MMPETTLIDVRKGNCISGGGKIFHHSEGFTRDDDVVPDRFFEEPLTVGEQNGAVLTKDPFKAMMDEFYLQRGWDPNRSKPGVEKLKRLGLAALLQ